MTEPLALLLQLLLLVRLERCPRELGEIFAQALLIGAVPVPRGASLPERAPLLDDRAPLNLERGSLLEHPRPGVVKIRLALGTEQKLVLVLAMEIDE